MLRTIVATLERLLPQIVQSFYEIVFKRCIESSKLMYWRLLLDPYWRFLLCCVVWLITSIAIGQI